MSDEAAARALALVQAVLSDVRGETPLDSADVLTALETLRHLRDEISAWEPELITAARSHGASWVQLAPALGVTSRQAAERRYLRLRPSTSGETTGEARVRAERDKRAGDRAVSRWARDNSADLRELAGQVSAATGSTMREALADDDPSALLSPLADAQTRLGSDHSGLVDRIETITSHTNKLREDARGRR
jgi:hypothetical protein